MLRRLRDMGLYMIAVLVGCGLGLSVVFGFGALVGEVQAASVGGDNACTEIGTAGQRIIYRCIDDETGMILFGNDAGFMVVVE